MTVTRRNNTQIDLIQGNAVSGILIFSAPLVLGNLFQQFYHIVDASMIGRSCGVEALAAVSCTGWVCWLINALCRDSGNAFGIMGAVRIGQKDKAAFQRIVVNAVIYTVIVGLAVMLLGLVGLKAILHWLQVPENILVDAGRYLLFYILCIPPMMAFNVAAALLRAVGNSRITMTAMIASTVVNIALDLFLILGMHLGVLGAAIATWISVVVSALIAIHACSKTEGFRFTLGELHADRDMVYEACKLLFPMFFNSIIIAIGGLVVLSQTNRLGSVFTGGKSAQDKIFALIEAIIIALQTGVSVFVGQNLGAKQYDRILNGLHRALAVALLITAVLSAGALVFLRPLLNIFLSQQDPVVYEEAYGVARTAFMFTSGGMLLMTPMYIYRVTIQALGHAEYAAISGFFQLVTRILLVWIGPGLIGIYTYYIPNCLVWLVSLPLVSIPCYFVIAQLKRQEMTAHACSTDRR